MYISFFSIMFAFLVLVVWIWDWKKKSKKHKKEREFIVHILSPNIFEQTIKTIVRENLYFNFNNSGLNICIFGHYNI